VVVGIEDGDDGAIVRATYNYSLTCLVLAVPTTLRRCNTKIGPTLILVNMYDGSNIMLLNAFKMPTSTCCRSFSLF